MIIDRALYLRRSIRRKLVFHLVSIIVIHIWFYNYLRIFGQAYQWPPLLFYFFKCIYLLLSAYQIRCGYPNHVSGNCCTNGFTKMHRFTFELWVCTMFIHIFDDFEVSKISIQIFVIDFILYHLCRKHELSWIGFVAKQHCHWMNGSKWRIFSRRFLFWRYDLNSSELRHNALESYTFQKYFDFILDVPLVWTHQWRAITTNMWQQP